MYKLLKVFVLLFLISGVMFSQSLTLISPNGGENWQTNRTPKIIWNSNSISLIRIDITYNNGVGWENISLNWPASVGEYVWYVPDSSSSECRIRLTDVSNETLTVISEETFTITSSSEIINIVVLGSSTAAGVGPSTSDSAWVNRYRKHVQQFNTAANVTNLAVGGYTTYEILPDGYETPTDRPNPSVGHNITKALSYSPIAIVINLPSNDVTNNYSVEEQLFNYSVVMEKADSANVPVWVATTQPRNLDDSKRQLQKDVRDSTYSIWGDNAIDFWTTFADDDGRIVSDYDSGDGVHLNNAGHKILFERVAAEDIPFTITSVEETIVSLPAEFKLEQNYPNPFNPITNIKFNLNEAGFVKLKVFNSIGQEVAKVVNGLKSAGSHIVKFNAQNLSSGFYFYTLQVGDQIQSNKMMLLK